MAERLQLTRCPDCGGMRIDAPGPHAPRFVLRQGSYTLVDCQMRPIPVPIPVGVGQ